MKVNSIGSLNSKIALIGEAPGQEEDLTGIPFIGSAGRRMNKLIYAAKINRSECYIDNVVQYRPPENRIDKLADIGLSLEKCTEELIFRLNKTKANVIVPLGRVALEALTGFSSIGKYRGSILCSSRLNGKRKIIPTFHPSYLLRIMGYSSKKEIESNKRKNITTGDVFLSFLDYLKIKKESEFPEINLPKRKFLISPSFNEVLEFLSDIKSLKWGEIISVDIEAFRNSRPIKCIGFGVSAELAMVIPIFSNKPWYSLNEEIEIWEMIKSILQSEKIKKIIQNEQYERLMLFPYVGEIRGVLLDNMIAQRLLFPELKLSLAVQASIFTDEPYFKDDAKSAGYTSEALWNYNGKDCTVEYEIGIKQIQMLKDQKLDNLAFNLGMPLSRIMWKASHIGIKININRVLYYREDAENNIDIWQERLDEIVGYSVNVKSTKQLGKLLYEELKIPRKIKKESGNITTDIKSLEELSRRYPREELQLIMKIRKERDKISKNLKDFWDSDNRIRASWLVPGTETGRLSCSKNIFEKGLNLQQVPAGKKTNYNMRDIFISDKDHLFLVFDASQVEARIVAYEAESPRMIEAFLKNEDIHSMVASWIFNKPIESCGKGTFERDGVAKHLVHGANYGISAKSFAEEAKISISRAKVILNNYLTMFRISSWQRKIVDLIRKNRILKTSYGRTRLFNGHWGESLFKEAYAYIPQSTAVDWINFCAIRIEKRISKLVDLAYLDKPELNLFLIQDHDEWVLQIHKSLVELAIKIIKEECLVPILIKGKEVRIPIELSIGKNWKSLESLESFKNLKI